MRITIYKMLYVSPQSVEHLKLERLAKEVGGELVGEPLHNGDVNMLIVGNNQGLEKIKQMRKALLDDVENRVKDLSHHLVSIPGIN